MHCHMFLQHDSSIIKQSPIEHFCMTQDFIQYCSKYLYIRLIDIFLNSFCYISSCGITKSKSITFGRSQILIIKFQKETQFIFPELCGNVSSITLFLILIVIRTLTVIPNVLTEKLQLPIVLIC